MASCKYCGDQIVWYQRNDRWVAFADKAGTTRHASICQDRRKEPKFRVNDVLLHKQNPDGKEFLFKIIKIDPISFIYEMRIYSKGKWAQSSLNSINYVNLNFNRVDEEMAVALYG